MAKTTDKTREREQRRDSIQPSREGGEHQSREGLRPSDHPEQQPSTPRRERVEENLTEAMHGEQRSELPDLPHRPPQGFAGEPNEGDTPRGERKRADAQREQKADTAQEDDRLVDTHAARKIPATEIEKSE